MKCGSEIFLSEGRIKGSWTQIIAFVIMLLDYFVLFIFFQSPKYFGKWVLGKLLLILPRERHGSTDEDYLFFPKIK